MYFVFPNATISVYHDDGHIMFQVVVVYWIMMAIYYVTSIPSPRNQSQTTELLGVDLEKKISNMLCHSRVLIMWSKKFWRYVVPRSPNLLHAWRIFLSRALCDYGYTSMSSDCIQSFVNVQQKGFDKLYASLNQSQYHKITWQLVYVVIYSCTQLFQDKTVIGHAVHNDFRVLGIRHPPHLIRDTSRNSRLRTMASLPASGGGSLKQLARILLGTLSSGSHVIIQTIKGQLFVVREYSLLDNSGIRPPR